MRKSHFVQLLSAAMLLVVGSMVIAADGPHDKSIKARQAVMQIYDFNIGILGAMAKGKRDYDADVASEAAANLDAAANLGGSQLWPPGSDSETSGNAKNRALPEIWSTFPAIGEKAQALTTATAALVPEAGNGLEALQGALGDVGDSCKGCHDDFRAEKK